MTGVSHFDAHRCNGHCVDPAELGLVEIDGLWSTPEGHERRAADADRLARLRKSAEVTQPERAAHTPPATHTKETPDDQ